MKTDKEKNPKSAGKLIGGISRAAHIYFQSQFKEYSIGHAQVRTLHYIAQNDGITQMELANYLNLDKSSITSQLNILEGNGYIKKHISKSDARKLQISITNKTNKILEPLKNVFSLWTETLLDGFSEIEKIELFKYLEQMQKNANNKIQEIKENNKN